MLVKVSTGQKANGLYLKMADLLKDVSWLLLLLRAKSPWAENHTNPLSSPTRISLVSLAGKHTQEGKLEK